MLAEFVEGTNLADALQEAEPRTSKTWVALGRGLVDGLERVHRAGLLHRDLKPHNVIVRRDENGLAWDRPCLVDFGFAAAVQEDTGRTLGGQIVGTPRYMSPEQIRGDALGSAADVYGLGIVLFEVLHGRSPYSGTSVTHVLQQVVNSTIDVPTPRSEFERAANTLLERCLAPDPSTRPKVAELSAALDGLSLLFDEPRQGDSTQVANEWRHLLEPTTNPAAPVEKLRDKMPAFGGRPIVTQEEVVEGPAREESLHPESVVRIPPPDSSLRAANRSLLVAAAILLILSATAILLSNGSSSETTWFVALIAGTCLFFAGMGLSKWLQDSAQPQRELAQARAQEIVLGNADPEVLSRSITIAVDEVVARCNGLDERILALSMRAMVDEHRRGETSGDRRAALLDLVSLLEKVRHRVSPWYIRYERQLSFVIKVTSAAAGLVGLIVAVLEFKH